MTVVSDCCPSNRCSFMSIVISQRKPYNKARQVLTAVANSLKSHCITSATLVCWIHLKPTYIEGELYSLPHLESLTYCCFYNFPEIVAYKVWKVVSGRWRKLILRLGWLARWTKLTDSRFKGEGLPRCVRWCVMRKTHEVEPRPPQTHTQVYIMHSHPTKMHVDVCTEVKNFTVLSLSICFNVYFYSIQSKIFSYFYFGFSVTANYRCGHLVMKQYTKYLELLHGLMFLFWYFQ